MELLVVFLIAYLGAPLAGLLFFIAALRMRHARPKRASAVIWSLATLLIGSVAITTLFDAIPLDPATLEIVALSFAGVLGAIAIIATLSLLFPLPDKALVIWLIVAGLICLSIAGVLFVELANTNFGL